jgi:uncharacterized protein YndB with AHSA1/START domain
VKLEYAIHIDAPPETVWEVTTDVERWPEWTPTVTSVEREDDGPLQVGSAARLSQLPMPKARWVVTELDPGRSFTWSTRVPGMHFTATHSMEACDGGTRNVLRVEAGGLTVLLAWPVVYLSIARALEQENEGLKARCEAMHGSAS